MGVAGGRVKGGPWGRWEVGDRGVVAGAGVEADMPGAARGEPFIVLWLGERLSDQTEPEGLRVVGGVLAPPRELEPGEAVMKRLRAGATSGGGGSCAGAGGRSGSALS